MLDKIKSMGQTSVALTDHGVMYGVVDFYKAAKARGLNPIIGCEVYVAPRSRFDKVHGIDNERYHLILLCKNNTGYKNLIKLVSEAGSTASIPSRELIKSFLSSITRGLLLFQAALQVRSPVPLSETTMKKQKKSPNGITAYSAMEIIISRYKTTGLTSSCG